MRTAKLATIPRDRIVGYLMLLPSALLLGAIVVVPLIQVVTMSFQNIGPGNLSGPWNGFQNYQWALGSSQFFKSSLNTAIWVVGTVTLEMLLGLMFALILSGRLVGRGLARTLLIFPYIIPTVVAVMIWRYQFHDLVGILNHALIQLGVSSQPIPWLVSPKFAMWAVITVDGWKHFPFVMIILTAAVNGIPRDQFEAAQIDGANKWQQFRFITLPNIAPVLLTTAMLRAIYNINSFDIIYLLTGGGPVGATQTLPILIYNKAFVDFQIGRASAIAVLTFIALTLLLVIYVHLYKRSTDHAQ